MKKVDMNILQTDLTLRESQTNKAKKNGSADNILANSLAGDNEFGIGEQLELSKTPQDDKTKKVKVKNSDGTESVIEYNAEGKKVKETITGLEYKGKQATKVRTFDAEGRNINTKYYTGKTLIVDITAEDHDDGSYITKQINYEYDSPVYSLVEYDKNNKMIKQTTFLTEGFEPSDYYTVDSGELSKMSDNVTMYLCHRDVYENGQLVRSYDRDPETYEIVKETLYEYDVECPDDIKEELSGMDINISTIERMITVQEENSESISMSAGDYKIEWMTEWNEEGTQVIATLKIYDKDGELITGGTRLLDKNGNIIKSSDK